MTRSSPNEKSNFGITLTGGGARGSYQAGVLRGLAEILKEQSLLGRNNPFQYWSGVSAGAINATFCAAGLEDLDFATQELVNLWTTVTPENVYETDIRFLAANSARWIRDLTFGPLFEKKLAKSLLNTKPLWGFLGERIPFTKIEENLTARRVKGVACSAYSYTSNQTVTFLQTHEDTHWKRHRRYSKKSTLSVEHVMASCAIPILFPTIKIGNEYFADGSFRNITPISPLVHMGAQKILVVGVRGRDEFSEKPYISEPGMAKMAGAILNALFFDTVDIDLERLKTTNELVRATKADIATERSSYSAIDYMVIRPSRDLSRIAEQKAKNFPGIIKFLVGGLGSLDESAELASYILFVSDFTKDLVELGYNDTIAYKSQLMEWMSR